MTDLILDLIATPDAGHILRVILILIATTALGYLINTRTPFLREMLEESED